MLVVSWFYFSSWCTPTVFYWFLHFPRELDYGLLCMRLGFFYYINNCKLKNEQSIKLNINNVTCRYYLIF